MVGWLAHVIEMQMKLLLLVILLPVRQPGLPLGSHAWHMTGQDRADEREA
jgi:hypothetical protein